MYDLFVVPVICIGIVVWLALNENTWFASSDIPMLEQIENARCQAAEERKLLENPVVYTLEY
jgi:hypothetical protein